MKAIKDLIYWKAAFKMIFGIPSPLITEDRRILEQVIFPYLKQNNALYRILFIGCNYYTWHYRKIFSNKEYWTIEPIRVRSMFGSKRHIVGFMRQIDQHFEKCSLDVIICNGVLGLGLNDPEEIEESFQKCFTCLREGGILVIGWNDIKERVFLPLEDCKSLGQFQCFVFPPLGVSKYPTETYKHHTFSFFVKPNCENTRLSDVEVAKVGKA